MNDKRNVTLSKFLSRVLRHTPEDLDLTLQPGGWVSIDVLLAAATAAGFSITRTELDEVVATSDKQRFAIDETGTLIRANQGHSTDVDLKLESVTPPDVLYHGTLDSNVVAIMETGLIKMSRHHVHLSSDIGTAMKVGLRRGRAVILEVDAARMHAEGHVFFQSANGVWLVDAVPSGYLRVQTPRGE